MMKYELEIVKFNCNDIVVTSGNDGTGGEDEM